MNPAVIAAVLDSTGICFIEGCTFARPCSHCVRQAEVIARAVLDAAVAALGSHRLAAQTDFTPVDGVLVRRSVLLAALLGPPGDRDGVGT